MVVEASAIQRYLRGRGTTLIRDEAPAILEIAATAHFFVPRAEAEVQPLWKQIIPYVVIARGDRIFTLQRTTKQSEARLHHKISIGIGGHINPGHDLHAGLLKELQEEVAVRSEYELQFIGIINDDETEVGRVHLGAMYLLTPGNDDVEVLETEKMTGAWRTRGELAAVREAMESWSQIAFDALIEVPSQG